MIRSDDSLTRPVQTPAVFRTGVALVVENDLDIQRLMLLLLDRHFERLDTASSIAEARGMMASKPYDLIILDLVFPGPSGFSLIDELYRRQSDYLERIVVVSAMPEQIVEHRFPLLKDRYLRKPFDIEHLLLLIEKRKRVVDERKRAAGGA